MNLGLIVTLWYSTGNALLSTRWRHILRCNHGNHLHTLLYNKLFANRRVKKMISCVIFLFTALHCGILMSVVSPPPILFTSQTVRFIVTFGTIWWLKSRLDSAERTLLNVSAHVKSTLRARLQTSLLPVQNKVLQGFVQTETYRLCNQ